MCCRQDQWEIMPLGLFISHRRRYVYRADDSDQAAHLLQEQNSSPPCKCVNKVKGVWVKCAMNHNSGELLMHPWINANCKETFRTWTKQQFQYWFHLNLHLESVCLTKTSVDAATKFLLLQLNEHFPRWRVDAQNLAGSTCKVQKRVVFYGTKANAISHCLSARNSLSACSVLQNKRNLGLLSNHEGLQTTLL